MTPNSGTSTNDTPRAGQRAVFLSYASEDAVAAQRICSALRAGGIEVWFDQSELRGGDAWDAAIRRQIRTCSLFIPILSNSSHSRAEGYFRLEWKLAIDRSHLIAANRAFLLPVVIDATSELDDRIPNASGRCSGSEFLAASRRRGSPTTSPNSSRDRPA